MKKNLISMVMMLTAVSASAQEVKVAEPEFINSYCILTSDSTFATLPKESGVIGKHENKVKKWSAADIVGAGGMIGAATAGSVGGVINGVRVMGGAAGVANAAGTVSGLAGSSGMDIIFKGGHSSYSFKADGNNVRLLIKGENNETEVLTRQKRPDMYNLRDTSTATSHICCPSPPVKWRKASMASST